MKAMLDRWVSREGRLSQQGYVVTFALPFLAIVALTASIFLNPGLLGALDVFGMYGLAFGWLFLMGMGDTLNIKRYHDIGNSGRLYRLCRPGVVGLPILAFVLHVFIPAQMTSTGDMAATMYLINQHFAPSIGPVSLALLVITVAGGAINVGYLSLMPGQGGANEYGPPPGGGGPVPGAQRPAAVQGGDDPVKRALADYQARQQQAARPAQPQPGAKPAATFGRKR